MISTIIGEQKVRSYYVFSNLCLFLVLFLTVSVTAINLLMCVLAMAWSEFLWYLP